MFCLMYIILIIQYNLLEIELGFCKMYISFKKLILYILNFSEEYLAWDSNLINLLNKLT